MAKVFPDLEGRTVWIMAKGFAPDEGGQQTYAEQVALAYARRGAEVTVFTQTSIGPNITNHGVMRLVDIGPGKNLTIPAKWLRALVKEKRRIGKAPNFVHATTWRTAVPPMVLGMKMAVTFHGREFMYAKGLAFRVMAQVARKAAPLVTVSHYSAGRLVERLGNTDICPIVAWNGVSIDPLPRQQQLRHEPLLFSLCRLEPRKNILAAVRVAMAAAGKGRAFHYVVCGRGPELQAIRQLVATHAMETTIEVAGFVDGARALELYSQADIFVHPQLVQDNGRDFEGFGIAIADAMIAGCAVIVGRDGGAAELVVDGESGLIVDGNNDAKLESAIAFLLDNPEMRAEIARRGQRRAAEYMRWDRHVELVLPV